MFKIKIKRFRKWFNNQNYMKTDFLKRRKDCINNYAKLRLIKMEDKRKRLQILKKEATLKTFQTSQNWTTPSLTTKKIKIIKVS